MKGTTVVAVSVVIPTRDRAALVVRAIRSVLAQTFRDFEIIVVDDASTDGTFERLSSDFAREIAEGRLRLHRNAGHLERSATRNAGIALARGEWIALLDDDDYFLPEHLERLAGAAARHPHLDFLNSEGLSVDPAGNVTDTRLKLPTDLAGERPEIAFRHGILWGSTSFFRKAMFERLGGFTRALDFGEDVEFFLRAAMTHRFGFLGVPTVMRTVHPASHATRAARERLAACRLESWRMIEANARRLGFAIPAFARGAAWLAIAEFHLHRPATARSALRRAFAADPRLLLDPRALKTLLAALLGRRLYRALKRLAGRG